MSMNSFFEHYLHQASLFKDKSVLSPSYFPEEVLYREELLEEVARILAPALRGEKPSNLFIYGKTGTGKTLSIKYLLRALTATARKNNLPLKVIYVNCKLKKVADTEYRLVAQFVKAYGKEVPVTGLPTDEVYGAFYRLVDEEKQILLLVLDEIDQLIRKAGDEVLYNLTRINAELHHSQICLIGISNNLVFSENLDPRVKSSLSEEELVFPSYNALQIQDILQQRVGKAFKPEALQPGVVEKCAAFAAREHGDARRAIDLLRIAGELAERQGSAIVELTHLDEAQKKAEFDSIINLAAAQPKQFQAVLYALLLVTPQKRKVYTGEIYEVYRGLCRQYRMNILTQRRVSDILAEFDLQGLITAQIVSKGRYGRTRDITFTLDSALMLKLKELLEKSLLA